MDASTIVQMEKDKMITSPEDVLCMIQEDTDLLLLLKAMVLNGFASPQVSSVLAYATMHNTSAAEEFCKWLSEYHYVASVTRYVGSSGYVRKTLDEIGCTQLLLTFRERLKALATSAAGMMIVVDKVNYKGTDALLWKQVAEILPTTGYDIKVNNDYHAVTDAEKLKAMWDAMTHAQSLIVHELSSYRRSGYGPSRAILDGEVAYIPVTFFRDKALAKLGYKPDKVFDVVSSVALHLTASIRDASHLSIKASMSLQYKRGSRFVTRHKAENLYATTLEETCSEWFFGQPVPPTEIVIPEIRGTNDSVSIFNILAKAGIEAMEVK